MRHRKNFNPKRHRFLDKDKLIGDDRKSKTDKLFEKIKEMEKQREKKDPDATIDTRIEEAAGKTTELKKPFKVMHLEEDKIMKTKIEQFSFQPEEDDPKYYIASDKRLAALLDYRRILREFVDMMKNANDQYAYCNSKVSESDREVQDFLHELRQPKRNACEGFKLYQLGHHLEVKRQGYKEAADDLRPVSNFANAYKEQTQKLENILAYLNATLESRNNTIYMPRSNLKLPVGDRFRSLSQEEQEEIRRSYERKKKKLV